MAGPGIVQPWQRFGSGLGARPGAGGALARSYQTPQGFVRVGGRPTVPARAAAPATAPPTAGGAPLPAGSPARFALPTGSYDPTRDVQTEESQRGLGQLEGEVGTARSRDTADYFTNRAEIQRRAGQQTADYQRAKQLLSDSFAKLGTRQEEGANQAGLLRGGAMLQAAAKRAANQGQQQTAADTTYARQQDANSVELAKLAREAAPPDATNALGGRQFQDLLTKLTNAQANNTFFGESQQRLAGQEAAERGLTLPANAPASHRRVASAARGLPTVASSRAQPATSGSPLLRRQSPGGALSRARQLARGRFVG